MVLAIEQTPSDLRMPWRAPGRDQCAEALTTLHHPLPVNPAAQVAAGFSAGSAVAVLAGGFIFCRLMAGGRRNLTFALCAATAGERAAPSETLG